MESFPAGVFIFLSNLILIFILNLLFYEGICDNMVMNGKMELKGRCCYEEGQFF